MPKPVAGRTAVLFNPHVYARPGDHDELYQALPQVRARFAEASAATGVDLVAEYLGGDEEAMNRHPISRPASLALAVGIWDAVREHLPRPDYVAGPSLGTLPAGYVAGYMSFRDAVRMCRCQALTEQQVLRGRALGVALYYNADLPWLREAMRSIATPEAPLEPCAVLADSQIIVSGAVTALGELTARAITRGTVGTLIPGGPPCHGSLPELVEIRERFAAAFTYLDPVQDPRTPMICNHTSAVVTTAEAMRRGYVDAYVETVHWDRNLRRLAELGVTHVSAIGPGQLLRRTVEFTDVDLTVRSLVTPEEVRDVRA